MAEHFVGGGSSGTNAGSGLRRRQLPCARGGLYTHIYAQSIASINADANADMDAVADLYTLPYLHSSPGSCCSCAGRNAHSATGGNTYSSNRAYPHVSAH